MSEPGEHNPSLETAKRWLVKKGFKLIGFGESKNGWVLISSTFQPLK